jgi:hypothetical protein
LFCFGGWLCLATHSPRVVAFSTRVSLSVSLRKRAQSLV